MLPYLISFITILFLAISLMVMRSSRGLELTEKFLGGRIDKKNLRRILNLVILYALVLAGILFVVLGHRVYLDIQLSQILKSRPCYGQICWNRDPKDNKCDQDATTITSTPTSFPGYGELYAAQRLEMLYSSYCDASWVKGIAPLHSFVYIEVEKGEKFGNIIKFPDGFYTDMGPGKSSNRRACVEPPPNGKPQCTNFISGA